VISERVKELAHQAYTGANKLIQIMLELGKSQKLAGDWEGTRDTCKAMIYEDTQSGTNAYPVQMLDTCLTICECSYRLGHYEEAIAFGKHAIKMNQPLNGATSTWRCRRRLWGNWKTLVKRLQEQSSTKHHEMTTTK
jgi:hypothetical protein